MILLALTEEAHRSKNGAVEQLLEQIAKGDSTAMGDLYDLIHRDVFAYALSKTANRHNAEDVMQDTFLQVYRYAPQYRPQGKPMAWIITIERNLVLRQQRRQSRVEYLDETLENTWDGEDCAEQIETRQLIEGLLARLSEEEREVVALHVVSGMKHREIASLMGKPLSTVLSKYNRAMKKLKTMIQKGEQNV